MIILASQTEAKHEEAIWESAHDPETFNSDDW
jgi:hypothetical protein